ncbi:C-signal-like [Conger conger]|uniref:C-signal-like n=1 Tax=Conger conger TaxID=82655 RepID=UPI002A5AB6F3|nr:C-signal-like [Conger conger]
MNPGIYSVLVTGSNRGIGLELVRQLAELATSPSQIFAGCRDPEGPRSKALQDLAQKHSNLNTVIPLDTTDPVSIKEASQVVRRKLGDGSLSLLINNAGLYIPGNLQETGMKEMVDVYATNVVGPMLVAKEFLPYMQRASALPGSQMPVIINVSSIMSSIEKCHERFSKSPAYAYRTSKAALNMLTRCMAEELKKDGILVTALHPGLVKTDMGGPQAHLTVVESVSGMLRVISSLTSEHSGTLLDWEGKGIPW